MAVSEKVSIDDARREIAGGDAQPVDIRNEDDFTESHVPGAINVRAETVEVATEGLEKGARLLVIGDEQEAQRAVAALVDHGFDAAIVEGGMKAWKSEGYTVQPSDDPGPEAGAESTAEAPGDAKAS